MNENHKELISMGLTVGIIALSLFIIHRFIPSMIWASIIVIATYPLYERWRRFFGSKDDLSALLFTTLIGLLLLLPLSWLVGLLIKELQIFINFLQSLNEKGGMAPEFLKNFPWIGSDLVVYWDNNIGKPGMIKGLLSNIHLSLTPTSYYVKQIGSNLAHRSVQVGFTLLSLFFFYRDGDRLITQIYLVGENCLGKRWFRYADRLPKALRATVNGTIVVGLGVGFLMGVCYGLVGFPAPTLVGFITALAAMIPFVVPIVFITVAMILFAFGSMFGAIAVLVWGTLVMFVADHFIKPALIGGAIELPFLAVLFGILGGVETLGLLGLFVGPLVMVLFVTLWQEPQIRTDCNQLNEQHMKAL
ncbi:AI-2E family transporter [Legionella longbeachae]|uniref:Putative predicted permease n=1 Tax=Legionella longbeachae serogroup 1 (strain NSW150) TaxID=661367 RepID=D3HQK4_LEGLN|nr:AI-2E family transporter [Legionella longbeachae]VEE01691.1 permease [Legionella oakridgensis]HBD7396449.1 AI-2E family transporter [Legionella pneumophila]ARB91973.1 AI-2E family transporter [Legionella longbeachae]ARM34842.1 AI-2E family transporter [Legionella longbeachae]QIN31617.1 AI-2E family transporter [Legionella longbeachae]